MKLKNFRIYNYKSIIDSGECDLSLEKITILAGQNESGKTTILEALRDFDYSGTISNEVIPDGHEELIPSIACCFAIKKEDLEELEDGKDEILLIPDNIKELILKRGEINLIKKLPDVYSIDLDDNIFEEWVKNIIKEEVEEIIESPTESIVPVIPAEPVVPTVKVKIPDNPKIKIDADSLRNKLIYGLLMKMPYFVYFDSFDGTLPKKKYLSELEDEDSSGYRACKDFIKIAGIDIKKLETEEDDKKLTNYVNSKCAEVNGDFLNYWTQKFNGATQIKIVSRINQDTKGRYLNFFIEDDTLKYPHQRSKGFLWFLSFYLRLNSESLDRDDTGAIILIDEPGSYLHPKGQKDILTVLKEKITKENNEVIFSTHSSELIDPERLNRIRLVYNKKEKGTKISKTTERVDDKGFADALSPIITAIGKDLGKDFGVACRKNVILEGVSDYYYLSTLRAKTGFKIPEDIRLIPMTGVFSIDYMVSIMIGWGLDYVVVMDRDENSEKEYKELTEELNVSPDKIFRTEGGKAIEDLFSEKDFKKYILEDESAIINTTSKADFIKSEKVILSKRFFEKYKDNTLTLEDETKGKFKKIFDFIKSSFV